MFRIIFEVKQAMQALKGSIVSICEFMYSLDSSDWYEWMTTELLTEYLVIYCIYSGEWVMRQTLTVLFVCNGNTPWTTYHHCNLPSCFFSSSLHFKEILKIGSDRYWMFFGWDGGGGIGLDFVLLEQINFFFKQNVEICST